MIKKVIFDVDNTLLMFDKKYINYYQDVLQKNGYSNSYEDAYNLFKSIGKYEKVRTIYDKKLLLDFVNEDLKKNYSISFIDDIIQVIAYKWVSPVSKELIDLLDYLSKKYELYVLTNLFTICQERRLEIAGISSYFKEIVGTDKVPIKPAPEAFLYFADNNNPDECVMIGDSINYDVEGALNVGMKAILFDYKKQYGGLKYQRVETYEEIKNIL